MTYHDRTTIAGQSNEVSDWTLAKGWRGPNASTRSFGDELMLIITELAEAMEAYRERLLASWESWPDGKPDELDVLPKIGKPEGVASEIADTYIRILDVCSTYGIDLEAEFGRKMEYNWTRSIRHGGKHL